MKRLVFLLRFFTVVAVVCTAAFAQKPDINWFASNSEANTFNIANADQLAGLVGLVNNTVGLGQAVDFKGKTIVLTDNIDLSKYGVNYNTKKGWIPIGIYHGTPFSGIFDGNGKTISGLYINGGNTEGLIGYMKEGEIKNLGLINVNITGYEGVGAAVGTFYGKIITNCYSTGSVKGKYKVGGVAGMCAGRVINCYSSATVRGMENSPRRSGFGGVVGDFSFGKNMTGCYFTGTVSGFESVGGVVGMGGGWDSEIANCYSTGTVSASGTREDRKSSILGSGGWSVGGVVGSGGGRIINCYSTGAVSGFGSVGGVVGSGPSGGLDAKEGVFNCYSIGAVSGDDNVGGVAGSGKLSNCVALNPSVKAKGTDFGRIIGSGDKLSNNAAFVGMTNNAGNSLWINKTATEKNGLDITANEIKTDPTIGGRFTVKNGWVTETGKLPGLGGAVDMPAHLK